MIIIADDTNIKRLGFF